MQFEVIKMNVAYFSNQFADKDTHGIGRYARHLYEALKKHNNTINLNPVAAGSNRTTEELIHFKKETGLRLLPTGKKLTPLLWTAANFPTIEQQLKTDFDLVHAVSLGYKIATNKPYVVTIHDIGPLTHPQFFGKRSEWIMKTSLKQAIKKADAFICVSNTTAIELGNYVSMKYKIDLTDRIFVSLEGVSEDFFNPTDKSQNDFNFLLNSNKSFILAVGKISPRKNLGGVIEAMANIKCKIPHHLVTVGGDGWDFHSVKKMAASSGIEDRIHFLGYVNDSDLMSLYRKADALVYPSLFEGFGLTVLEAMASGCPVITSNISSLPEVAGSAGILVNPNDTSEIADAIELLCTNQNTREHYSSVGKNHARKFSWEKSAEEVAKIYFQFR